MADEGNERNQTPGESLYVLGFLQALELANGVGVIAE
jgi:hypothetical protein